MYYVVNYDSFTNHGTFTNYYKALDMLKSVNQKKTLIEYFDRFYRRRVVYYQKY